MRTCEKIFMCIAVLALPSIGTAQMVKIELHSRAQFAGTSNVKEWTFSTKYGVLKIPTSEVQHIQVGMHYEPMVKTQIEKNLERLASKVHLTRETAQKDLIEMGKYALPFMRNETKDLEQATRQRLVAEAILKHSPRAKDYVAYDSIKTVEFVAKGDLQLETIELSNADFGSIKVKLARIEKIVVLSSVSQDFVLNSDGVWLDTGLHFEKNQNITISAEGTVDLWPIALGSTLTDPNGVLPLGKGGTFKAGALIAKIGKEQFVGTGSTICADKSGNLQLLIVESPWNSPAQGGYKVKVKND